MMSQAYGSLHGFFAHVEYNLVKPILSLTRYLEIDIASDIPLIERSTAIKTGTFFVILGLLFWFLLHMTVLFISGSIASIVYPTPSDRRNILSTSAGKLWRVQPAPIHSSSHPSSDSVALKKRRHSSRHSIPAHPCEGCEDEDHDEADKVDEKMAAQADEPKKLDTDQRDHEAIMLGRRKFNVAFWKAVNYSFLLFIGYRVLGNEHWIFDYGRFAVPLSHVPISVCFYYHLAMGSYIYATACLFIDPRMKDFHVMLGHHVVTLALLSGSYYYNGCVRIGMIVMVLHDVCDPFMELAKLCLYSNLALPANIFFLTFAGLFVVSRCVIYPKFVVFPLWSLEYAYKIPGAYCFLSMLYTILFMDIYWTFLIFRMIFEQILKGSLKADVRED